MKTTLKQLIEDFEKTNQNNSIINFDGCEISLKDLETNSIIFGSTGSGKTKTTLLPILESLIKNNLPGLIIDVKNNFTDDVYKIAKKHNRESDIIEIGSHESSININILNGINHDMLMHVLKSAILETNSYGDNTSWIERGFDIFFDISKMYYTLYEHNLVGVPTLSILYTLISSEKYANAIFSLYLLNKNLYEIEFEQIYNKISSNVFHLIDLNNPFGDIDRTKQEQLGWTIGKISSVLSYFALKETEQKFSNFENFDFTLDFDNYFYKQNKIIVIRFKDSANPLLSRLVSSFISVKSKEDIMLFRRDKYSFKMVDEYQNNIDPEHDASWLDKSREFKNIQIFATQSISALLSKDSNKDTIYTIIDNCKNKFFLNSNNVETMKYYKDIALTDSIDSIKLLEGSGEVRECIYNNGNKEELLNLNFNQYRSISFVHFEIPKNNSLDPEKFEILKREYYRPIFEEAIEEENENEQPLDILPILSVVKKNISKSDFFNKRENDIKYVSKFRKFIKGVSTSSNNRQKLLNQIKLKEHNFLDFSFEECVNFIIVGPKNKDTTYADFMANFSNELKKQTFISEYEIWEANYNNYKKHLYFNCVYVFIQGGNFEFFSDKENMLKDIQLHLDNTCDLNAIALGHSDFVHPLNLSADFVYNTPADAGSKLLNDLEALSREKDIEAFIQERKIYSWNVIE